jgi:hypothetical protein
VTKTRSRIAWTLALALGAWLLIAPPAAAYIDGGSGAFIFQAVIAFAMAAGVTVKMSWRRIKALFGGKKQTVAAGEERQMEHDRA